MKVSPHRLTHGRLLIWAFAVWLGLVTGNRPRAHPALYLPDSAFAAGWPPPAVAVPPYISGRTSYLRVRLAFHPYPQVIPRFCNTGGYAPRRGLTPASRCPWIAHPVSGRIHATFTCRPLQTRFRFGSRALPPLNLVGPAPLFQSGLRSRRRRCTRRIILQKARRHPWGGRTNRPPQAGLRLLAGAGFQGLFHPPRGVLFTFPSRYSFPIGRQRYLALEGGPPRFPRDFSCPVVLRVPGTPEPPPVAYGALTRCGAPSQALRLTEAVYSTRGCPKAAARPYNPGPPPLRGTRRFGLVPVRSPLLRESRLISAPRGTEMFQFPRCPPAALSFQAPVPRP
jgi:hypothetical protein